VLAALPGNRLELFPEEDTAANGNNRHTRNGNNRNGQQRGTPRSSLTGLGLRGSGGGGRGRSGGGGGGSSAAAGGTAGADEFDPWSLLNELLDFVRWLRGLDSRRYENACVPYM
jgi:hypothetical protein